MSRPTETVPRSDSPTGARAVEVFAQVMVVAGFVLMTLGILEIGGLFNVGVGLAAVWVGCLVLFGSEARERIRVENDFLRQLEDL
jgi:hypothetical protein